MFFLQCICNTLSVMKLPFYNIRIIQKNLPKKFWYKMKFYLYDENFFKSNFFKSKYKIVLIINKIDNFIH